MKPSQLCTDGCVAHSMLEQLDALRQDLAVARLDLNALFRQRLYTDRRHRKLKPNVERRK